MSYQGNPLSVGKILLISYVWHELFFLIYPLIANPIITGFCQPQADRFPRHGLIPGKGQIPAAFPTELLRYNETERVTVRPLVRAAQVGGE
jgi:hypothetical protein